MRIWGCLPEVRIYNPQENKLDPRTISGYFTSYSEKSKGYRFCYPSHTTRIMESRNTKFLENDLVNGNGQFQDNLSEKDHHQSEAPSLSHRLNVIHTHEVECGIRKPIIEEPRPSKPMDLIVEEHQNVKQLIEPSIEQKVIGVNLVSTCSMISCSYVTQM